MSLLLRIWKDIQRGENIDLYATVMVALVLAVLNVTGVLKVDVQPLILAVMALLAFASLGNRHRLEMILERTSSVNEKALHEDFPPEFNTDLERAREIWLIGVHQSDILIRYYSLFEKKLKQGDYFRVLLVDPSGAASKMTGMRFPGQIGSDQERARINSSLNTLCALKQVAPSRMEIRVIDFLFAYGGFVLDPETSSGAVYTQRYTFRTLGGSRKPKLVYKRGDGRWYDLICSEVRGFWEVATPWQCNNIIPQDDLLEGKPQV